MGTLRRRRRHPAAPRLRRGGTVAGILAVVALASGCGGGSVAEPAGTAVPTGPVDVLYAGSLLHLMEQGLGPAFHRAHGYTLSGFAAGSRALASEIRGGTRQGDVFVSASPDVDRSLRGTANGDWVRWYATFATSPLVLGYNPASRYAHELRTKPWYQVVTSPGFLLGRTDPTTDPKGKLAVQALDQEAQARGDQALRQLAAGTAGVFPEETLVGRLQSGQLDAGFFYKGEAVAAGIPTVPLAGTHLEATYTVTVLERAPHPAAARSFVAFLVGDQGRAILRGEGFAPEQPPKVTDPAAVPAGLRQALRLR